MPDIIGEYVDRLCTVEMRPQGMPRGMIHRLYDAARRKQGRPLTLLAAEKLIQHVGKRDFVLIATGAGATPWLPAGETDGPLGAAGLARALSIGLGAVPVFVAEEAYLKPIVGCSVAAGVPVMGFEQAGQRFGTAVSVAFPTDDTGALAASREILEKFRPKAVIALERLGPNAKGVIHAVTGSDITKHNAKLHHLVDQAKERGIATIGVGDGGNEIGCGLIYDDVREISAVGRKCKCPCGDGMATVTATDVLVIGAISNWGGYGIETCLGLLLKDPDVLHDEATEKRMLEACLREGGFDGMYLVPTPLVDGIRVEVQAALITMLHEILRNALKTVGREI